MPIYSLKDGEMDDKPPFYKSLVEGKGEKYGADEELRVKKSWGTEHTISNLSFMTDEMKKETMAIYYGMVSQLDHHIGRILDYLEEKNMIDNTLIVFTSDHGDYMGNHGMWWKGPCLHMKICRGCPLWRLILTARHRGQKAMLSKA